MKPNIDEMLERKDVNGLLKALNHKDEDVRANAVIALGEVGDFRAVKPLQKLKNSDSDITVRTMAEHSLKSIQQGKRSVVRTVQIPTRTTQTPNNSDKVDYRGFGGIIIGVGCLGFILIILFAFSGAFSSDETTSSAPPASSTPPASTTPEPNTTTDTSSSEEDGYKQWLNDNYHRWDSAGDSYAFYALYQDAKAQTPPEKYREFHEHWTQYYYYMAKSYELGEQGDMVGLDEYRELALQEEQKYKEIWPEFYDAINY